MTEQISSSEKQEQTLIRDIADVLEIDEKDITIAKTLRGSTKKKRRFIYGFTAPTKRGGQKTPAGFFKISGPKHAKQLRREGLAVEVAGQQMDVPTVNLITSLRKMSGGRVILEMVALDFEKDGRILPASEQIATAEPVLGTRAARTLCAFSGRQIPEGVNDLVFKRGDWRNKSPRCFWRNWQKHSRIFEPRFKKMVDGLIGTQKLKSIIGRAERDIGKLLEKGSKGEKYFVHNDASPSNMFFRFNGETLLLDFEHSGVTRHQILAFMTDLGNYSGRCWPNPKMQQEFLVGCLKNENLGSLEDRHKLVKGMAVFGAIFLAKYGMSQRHREHQMSVLLLENLEPALARINREYTQLSSS